MKFSPSIFVPVPAVLIAASLLLTNCSSDNSPTSAAAGAAGAAGAASTGPEDPSFTAVKGIIQSSCLGGNGCHSQEGNPMLLKIDSTLHDTLVNHMTATCGKLVNTASPTDSALVKILKADCNGTPRMPWDKCFQDDPSSEQFCVQPDKIAEIQTWITKGAPK